MAPPPLARIGSRQATVQLTTPMTLTSKSARISWRGRTVKGWLYLVRCLPALLMSTSTPPNSATVASTAASTCTSSATSQPTASAVCPEARSASTSFSAAGRSTSTTTTAAPSSASARPNARPKPTAPPVMNATLPSKRNGNAIPPRVASSWKRRNGRYRSPAPARRDRGAPREAHVLYHEGRGRLAQLVERRPYKPVVGGSSPSAPTLVHGARTAPSGVVRG